MCGAIVAVHGTECVQQITSAILQFMKSNAELTSYFNEFGKDIHVEAQHTLLRAGDVANGIFLVRTGAVRLCVCSAQGDEISVQFFFEGDVVSSLESMLSGCPSEMQLITMEACHLRAVDRVTVLELVRARRGNYFGVTAVSALTPSHSCQCVALSSSHRHCLHTEAH